MNGKKEWFLLGKPILHKEENLIKSKELRQ